MSSGAGSRLAAMKAFPVVISGAGPVGLTLSTLLSRLGVSNVVVEKASRLSEHPSAHFISCRSMEIFRHAFSPALWSALQSCIPSLALWRHFSYAVHMTGREIGRVDHFAGLPASASTPSHALQLPPHHAPTPAQVLARHSPAHVAHLSQKRLMPHLLDAARKAGSTVLLDHEVDDVTESDSGVSLSVRNHAHGSFETLSCHYLVAADGANSRIRKHMGIDVTGPAALQNLINVHFSSRELARMLTEQQAHAMLHFVYNKDVLCVLVTHDFESGEFVCQLPYFPPIQAFEDFTESQCVELVVSAVGHDISKDVKVHSIRPWTMQCQITDRYFSHPSGSRVILVGDAAHRFPPSGGLGMNTGVQDAHNLAWKLALIEHGRAPNPTALLHTYEVERRPAAAVNATLSLKNFQRSLRVAEALGLDKSRVTDIVESAGPLMPKPLLMVKGHTFDFLVKKVVLQSGRCDMFRLIILQPADLYEHRCHHNASLATASSAAHMLSSQRAFEGVLSLGRRPLMCLETPGNAYGDQLMEKAREVLRDGAGLPLLFPLHDLGFRYEPSTPESLEPLVDSATLISPDISHTDTPTTAHDTTSDGEQGAMEVLGSVIVGSRVPHIPVLLEGCPISTTDLPDQLMTAASSSPSRDDALRCPFAVLLIQPKHRTGAVLKSVTWEGAQVSVVTVEVVSRGAEQSLENAQTIPVGAMSEGVRCKVVEATASGFVRAVDAWGRWEKEVGVGKGVLVRPDGHVWMVLPEDKLGKHWQDPEE